jgi:TonB family protein
MPSLLQPDWQSTKIFQTVEPLFPYQLQQVSVSSGEARVVINVDASGKLNEWLVIGYTMPDFADAAVRALKQWKFEPARLRGEPVGTTVELVFHFEIQGTMVVSQTMTDTVTARMLQLMAGAYVYRPCSLKDLDRIPTPVYTVSPAYPHELVEKGARGKVVINFFIDETGAVRMPSGSAQEDDRLSGLAIAALRQWKFEPPTRNGRPVLVAAQQVFNFGPTDGN